MATADARKTRGEDELVRSEGRLHVGTEEQETSETVRKEQIQYADGTGKRSRRGNEPGRGDRRGPQH
ncbi:hypothetical protein ACFVYD_13320 [Streptomyces sp. NPDC058301]|uniref:hypothetical protein n=1 Tax=Streptomyces sp. NPDC058301 TaxID=3346436 RepID=UPI0036E97E20